LVITISQPKRTTITASQILSIITMVQVMVVLGVLLFDMVHLLKV
jgi:hypothetical protein